MRLYSIVKADVSHIDEICADVKRQYDEGIANCALFMTKLVPEGNPPIDKAGLWAADYILFRDRLAEMGIPTGILVQCTIGHGYNLNQMFPFQRYINLTDGKPQNIVCPSDEGARAYFKAQMKTLAALRPATIMIDDDFRLMFREGRGCACPRHMAAVRRALGRNIEREELFSILSDRHHPERRALTDIFVETQREAIVDLAHAIREGMDEVDPTIPGVYCATGPVSEFGAENAGILAGKGNPPVVRINNGNYAPTGSIYFSDLAQRCATQSTYLRRAGVTEILAETDTCPHNRYSTSAHRLHSHFTASILEGVSGAKHWITRLATYEPRSGDAYRKILAKYAPFYEALSAIVPTLSYFGCRMPIASLPDYGFTREVWFTPKNGWSLCSLERMGLPIYFSAEEGGAAFLEGDLDSYTDEELLSMCRGTLVLSSDAAEDMCARGFSAHIGVTVSEWKEKNISFEFLPHENGKCNVQQGIRRLIPNGDETLVDATFYHLVDGVEKLPIAPATTVYHNALGGTVICYAGTPKTPHTYGTAFSFLSETRKAQFVRLLRATGNLPMYYLGDEVVYMKAARTAEGELFTALFNIDFDPVEKVSLALEGDVSAVWMLAPDGCRVPLSFTHNNGVLCVDTALLPMTPLILFIKQQGR